MISTDSSPHIPYRSARHATRRIPTLAILLCLCVLCSCVKNEFKLVFKLPENVNTTYRLSYYASDARGGIQVETAIAVAAGKAEATGLTRYPTLGVIAKGGSDIPAAIFYAERGDEISFTGKNADPLDWEIGGNDVNKTLTAWRLKNADIIRKAADTPRDAKDTAPRRKLNKAVADFIAADKDSKASPLLLISYFDASLQPEEFNRLYHMLDESGAAATLTHLLSRQDILTSSAQIAQAGRLRLSDIRLQNPEGIADTLRLKSASSPVLIYYWRKNDPRHAEILDSLKALAKWRPDSAAMQITDISLTSDSVQWAGSVRRDSLRHTLRAFMPRGLADTTAMAHGVRSTPWFIVSSGKGKAVYVGSDIAEAAKQFRKLRPKQKS